ncbi:MAG TPA: GPW/gp25 family protein [Kofleriaceae bacterium]|jgi:phage baseplate assembly protein W|nr:GPW/gp25 family protein [Kofleriaceae bacterium]
MKGYPAYLSFPFRIGSDGRTASPPDLDAHVRDELLQLLLTSLGERLFLPELGTNLRRLVFENTSEATLGLTQSIVTDALSKWLGTRLVVESLTIDSTDSAIEVVIQYRPIGSQTSKLMKLKRAGG